MCKNDSIIVIYSENIQYHDPEFYVIKNVKTKNSTSVLSVQVFDLSTPKLSIISFRILRPTESY